MRKRHGLARVLLPAVVLYVGWGCAEDAEPPPFQPVSTVGELMHDVVIPNAEIVWDSVGTIFTLEETEEIAPAGEDEWVAVQGAARTLMEAGNLLMMEGRAKDSGAWMERSGDLVRAGAAVLEAAEAQDAAMLFDRGELIFNACQGCHWDYRFDEDPGTIRTH